MLSEERMGVSFTTAAGPRQSNHPQVRVRQDSRYFTVSDSRLPQTGGSGPRICIPQEQGGPVIPQAVGSLFVANIKIDLRDIEWDGMEWIDLAQYKDKWRALVKTVMSLRVP
jgi:hypothetical protein